MPSQQSIDQWIKTHISKVAKNLDIPNPGSSDDSLQWKSYKDVGTQRDIIQIWFRTFRKTNNGKRKPKVKYGFEVAQDPQSGKQVIKSEIERGLHQMEETYHDEEGNTTYYKKQPFFWSHPPAEELEWSVEVKCATCNSVESINTNLDTMEKKQDIILLYLIKECYNSCDCPDRTQRTDSNKHSPNPNLKTAEGQRFTRFS